MRKTRIFNSYDAYEDWTEQFSECSDYDRIPVVIDNGHKIACDMFVTCKKWQTAINTFEKIFSAYDSEISAWCETMRESCEAGIFSESSYSYLDGLTEDRKEAIEKDIRESGNTYSWCVESTDDNEYYVCLNISGNYRSENDSDPDPDESSDSTEAEAEAESTAEDSTEYICYETSQCMSKFQWQVFYIFSGEIDKSEYPDFVTWWEDMRKSGVLELAQF